MRAPGSAGFRRRNAIVVAAGHFGPDMTPMVDIVMVILIFFMAGSAFIGPEWFLDVGMAKGAAPTAAPAQPALELPAERAALRLRAGPAGETLIDGLGLSGAPLDALSAKLREYSASGAAGAVRLVIEPTSDTPYQDVIAVYDQCARSGFAGVGLAKARQE